MYDFAGLGTYETGSEPICDAVCQRFHFAISLEAHAYAEECLALSEELGYDKGKADALYGLARVALIGWQDLDAADHYSERSLASYRTLGDPVGIASALLFLAKSAIDRANFSRARTLAEEGLSAEQRAGFRTPNSLWILGDIAYAEGDLDRARSLYEQALAMERQRGGDMGVYVHTLMVLASIARRQGDFTAAHAYMDQGLARAKQSGNDNDSALYWCYLLMAILVQEEGDYGSTIRWYRASLPRMNHSRKNWSNWGLGLAALAVALDQHELASRLLGATEAVSKTNYRLWPMERKDYNRLVDAARARLGAARFEAVWIQGSAQGFEQVTEEAVSILEAVLQVQNQGTPT